MTYKNFPTELVPASNKVMLTSPTFNFTSAFTGVNQNVIHPGARWTIEMTFSMLKGQQKRILQTFLNGLHGKAEAIKVYDHSREGKPAMGAPAVSGDGQTGRRLLTNGWIANQKVLEIGDLITVNNELKEVSEDVWTDDQGTATVVFNPPLRKQPPNGALLETESPYMLATMDSDGIAVSNMPVGFGEFETIVFREAIYK